MAVSVAVFVMNDNLALEIQVIERKCLRSVVSNYSRYVHNRTLVSINIPGDGRLIAHLLLSAAIYKIRHLRDLDSAILLRLVVGAKKTLKKGYITSRLRIPRG